MWNSSLHRSTIYFSMTLTISLTITFSFSVYTHRVTISLRIILYIFSSSRLHHDVASALR